jgi:Tfp pilus assembly protein PilP
MVLPLLLAKTVAKSVGKAAVKKARKEAKEKVDNLKDQAKNKATNYLDAKKRRIYETPRGAIFTNTNGGNKNYNPTPVYENVPGSNVTTKL